MTSNLCQDLELNLSNKLLPGMTLVGDNAYIKKKYMAVPLKGQQMGYKDAYNFYLSQLRITIERAFGVLVHCWSILRGPLMIPLTKIAPLVLCLCRLHNFCIDNNEQHVEKATVAHAHHIQGAVNFSNAFSEINAAQAPVALDENNIPSDLLFGGHHFNDAPRNRRSETNICPMDNMMLSVQHQNLMRPMPRGRNNLST
jgi:hypothetical protein